MFLSSREFKDGYNAYLDGLSVNDNPYEDDVYKSKEWEAGYYQAMEDDWVYAVVRKHGAIGMFYTKWFDCATKGEWFEKYSNEWELYRFLFK